jgi:hypothetical protein
MDCATPSERSIATISSENAVWSMRVWLVLVIQR